MTDNKTIQRMRGDLLIIYNAISDGIVLKSPLVEEMIAELNEKILQFERARKIISFPHGNGTRAKRLRQVA